MTEYEAYQEHIRYTHDTYCRIVIRHASFDAARMLAARWRREISLEYLTEEKFVQLSATDEYFQVPDYGETYPFSVRGQTILLDSCSLATALAGAAGTDAGGNLFVLLPALGAERNRRTMLMCHKVTHKNLKDRTASIPYSQTTFMIEEHIPFLRRNICYNKKSYKFLNPFCNVIRYIFLERRFNTIE